MGTQGAKRKAYQVKKTPVTNQRRPQRYIRAKFVFLPPRGLALPAIQLEAVLHTLGPIITHVGYNVNNMLSKFLCRTLSKDLSPQDFIRTWPNFYGLGYNVECIDYLSGFSHRRPTWGGERRYGTRERVILTL